MAKKIKAFVKLALSAGKATPAPPVGPALGQHGVNIAAFCKEYNAKTVEKIGLIVPVKITIYEDKSYSFILKSPPASVLLAKFANIKKGASQPDKESVGNVSLDQVKEIAIIKMNDLNTDNIEKAISIIKGTAKNMGIKVSKRIKLLKSIIKESSYSVEDGINLIKQLGTAKFTESVEAHVSLNIDPKYGNQQLRTSLVLPNGTGKSLRIAVFSNPESVSEMLKLGATVAGSDDLIENINLGKLDFDLLITTPQLMPKLAKLGRVLGPKGLMPSPKSGTVTSNLEEAINEFKKGKLEYRADKTGIVHLSFGKTNFSIQELKENLLSVYQSIEKNKPSGVKGKYFKSFNLCTTMSPSIKLDLSSFKSN